MRYLRIPLETTLRELSKLLLSYHVWHSQCQSAKCLWFNRYIILKQQVPHYELFDKRILRGRKVDITTRLWCNDTSRYNDRKDRTVNTSALRITMLCGRTEASSPVHYLTATLTSTEIGIRFPELRGPLEAVVSTLEADEALKRRVCPGVLSSKSAGHHEADGRALSPGSSRAKVLLGIHLHILARVERKRLRGWETVYQWEHPMRDDLERLQNELARFTSRSSPAIDERLRQLRAEYDETLRVPLIVLEKDNDAFADRTAEESSFQQKLAAKRRRIFLEIADQTRPQLH